MLQVIETLKAAGVPTPAIRVAIKSQGFKAEEIAAALPTAKKKGFASQFYDYLAEEKRSTEEVADYVNNPAWGGKVDDKGKTNIQRHLAHYEEIAKLARKIHEANEEVEEDTEEEE
jgi:hypothetical protein